MVSLLAAASVLSAGTSCIGQDASYGNYGQQQQAQDPASQRGYQDGIRDGEHDLRNGHSANPTKTEHYEDAPGYDSSLDGRDGYSKDAYKQAYRQAYTSGYQQGFYPNNSQGYDQGQGQYPQGRQQQYENPASQRGYQDGIRDGEHDLRNGHRANATKTEHYEDAPGYESSFGSKDEYKQIYRQAYTSGYQQGFYRRDSRGYDQGQYPQQDRQQQYQDPAYQRGFQDGINDGQHDLRNGHSANPTKTEHYEDAPGYDSSYSSFGNKEQYKLTYRQAYMSGYQRGFEQRGEYYPPQ